jgi:hypothetical protein
MGDVLIIGDTFRTPELRHEIPLGVHDPFVYLEHDDVRHVYVGSVEAPRIRGLSVSTSSCTHSSRSISTSSSPKVSDTTRFGSSGSSAPAYTRGSGPPSCHTRSRAGTSTAFGRVGSS